MSPQVRAIRLSFVGELGWELHVPRESCIPVYQALMAAGAKHGLVNAGYRAIDSLSIEKGESWEATQATRKKLRMFLSLASRFSHPDSLYLPALYIFSNTAYAWGLPIRASEVILGSPGTHLDSER